MNEVAKPDAWAALRTHTAARIALGRSGASLPTAELLRFGLAHAQARDAVHATFDAAAVRAALAGAGFESIEVESAAGDRATYLRRPDLGRRLSAAGAARLAGQSREPCDIAVVIGDGLSAAAANGHAAPLVIALHEWLAASALSFAPVVLAHQARVALGDEIGQVLRARLVVMLVGERPGLSSPDSLGAYLTLEPKPGCSDAQRNCVSNIRPQGLPIEEAARKIAWLVLAARQRGLTGVALKDESDAVPRLA
jgi:ethanolamine ammonia-lyase small subunit